MSQSDVRGPVRGATRPLDHDRGAPWIEQDPCPQGFREHHRDLSSCSTRGTGLTRRNLAHDDRQDGDSPDVLEDSNVGVVGVLLWTAGKGHRDGAVIALSGGPTFERGLRTVGHARIRRLPDCVFDRRIEHPDRFPYASRPYPPGGQKAPPRSVANSHSSRVASVKRSPVSERPRRGTPTAANTGGGNPGSAPTAPLMNACFVVESGNPRALTLDPSNTTGRGSTSMGNDDVRKIWLITGSSRGFGRVFHPSSVHHQ